VARFSILCALLLALGGAAAPTLAYPARATEAGAANGRAVTWPRIAVLIHPHPAGGSARAMVAVRDREVLAERFKAIGFDVLPIGPGERPALAQDLRAALARLPEGADVVVVALGETLGASHDFYLASSTADAGSVPLDTRAVRVGDLLRRLSTRHPREVVVILDECRSVTSDGCAQAAAAAPSDASIIGGERVDARNRSTPLASPRSLREMLLIATAEEGAVLPASYDSIARMLAGTDLRPLSSPRLSASFAFLPLGYFAGLATECGRVDPNAELGTLETGSTEAFVRACDEAVANYPFTRFFSTRREAAREQLSFLRAVSSCAQTLPAASYRSSYPTGRFRGAVDDFSRDCERRAQEARDDRRRREAMTIQDEPSLADRSAPHQPGPETDGRRGEQTASRRDPATFEEGTYHYVTGLDPDGDNWLALRSAPSLRVGWRQSRMESGTLLTVLGREGDWLHVRLLSGVTGYAYARYVSCCRARP
jgi:hypothetical protein